MSNLISQETCVSTTKPTSTLPTEPSFLGAVQGGLFVTAAVNGEIRPVFILADFAVEVARGWNKRSDAWFHQNFADPVVSIHVPQCLLHKIWSYSIDPSRMERLTRDQAEQIIACGTYFFLGTTSLPDRDIRLL